jgi:hypothetical protein
MANEINIQGLTSLNCDLAKRLPIDPKNGDEICDSRGNRYRFNGKTNTWIFIGAIHIPSTVTESTDGIITPEVFGKLRHVENIITNGVDFSQFKIFPGTEGYWYYFRSGDKSIKFDVEGEDQLRIEIDSGRFHQIISKRSCKGQFGEKGKTGGGGDVGDSSPAEAVFVPSDVNEDKIDFAIFTPIPLDKPISLRLLQCGDFDITNNCGNGETIKIANEEYQTLAKTQIEYFAELIKDFKSSVDNFTIEQLDNLKRFIANKSLGSFADVELSILLSKIRFMARETICDISTIAEEPDITILIDPKNNVPPTVTVRTEEFEIDEERTFAALKYDMDIGVLSGTVYLKKKTWKEFGKWCIKSRQSGPTGPDGEDGLCTLDIKEVSIDPRNIFTLCPIVNVRYDNNKDILYTLCSDIGTVSCADKIILTADSSDTTNENAVKSRFAAVIRSIDDCKNVTEYKVSFEEDDIPELTFSHWDPQPGCQTSRHYDRHKFDWFVDAEGRAKEGQNIPQWYGIDGDEVNCLTADYPNKIITASKPEEQCCTEDFFYCPNIQEAPAECGEDGDLSIEITPVVTTTTTTTTTAAPPPPTEGPPPPTEGYIARKVLRAQWSPGTDQGDCNTRKSRFDEEPFPFESGWPPDGYPCGWQDKGGWVHFYLTDQQIESWGHLFGKVTRGAGVGGGSRVPGGSIKLADGTCVQAGTVLPNIAGVTAGGHSGLRHGQFDAQFNEYFPTHAGGLPVYKGTACDDPSMSYYFVIQGRQYKRGCVDSPKPTCPNADERGYASPFVRVDGDGNVIDACFALSCCSDSSNDWEAQKVCVKDIVLVHDAPDGFTDPGYEYRLVDGKLRSVVSDPATTVHLLVGAYDSCDECAEAIGRYF